jgi:hypothetical protein
VVWRGSIASTSGLEAAWIPPAIERSSCKAISALAGSTPLQPDSILLLCSSDHYIIWRIDGNSRINYQCPSLSFAFGFPTGFLDPFRLLRFLQSVSFPSHHPPAVELSWLGGWVGEKQKRDGFALNYAPEIIQLPQLLACSSYRSY